MTETFESPPLIQTILNDINAYLTPVVDAAAAVTGQWEVILAAAVLDAVQAGEDFANGADLQGAFSALAAIGGALDAIGTQGFNADSFNFTAGAEESLGQDLQVAAGIAQNIDGVVQGGSPLAIITYALGGASGIASIAGLSEVAQYAAVGADLAGVTQALGTGNVLAALASLVEAAQTSGVLQSLEQDVEAMFLGFTQSAQGINAGASQELMGSQYSSSALPQAGTDGATPTEEYTPLVNQNTGKTVGFYVYDPTDSADNAGLEAAAQTLANSDNGSYFIIAGHGSPTGLSASPNSKTAFSPLTLIATAEKVGYVEGSGEEIQLFACNANSPNTAYPVPTTRSGLTLTYNGILGGQNLAQAMANDANAPIKADTGYVIVAAQNSYAYGTGAYIVDNISALPGSAAYTTQSNADWKAALAPYIATNTLPGPGLLASFNNGIETIVNSNLLH